MQVQTRSSNGITLVPLDSRLLADRKVFIEGEIEAEMASEFLKQMMLLTQEDAEKQIDVFINSNGGEINAGLMMYDTIQTSIAPVRMFCTGHAYSMAAVLFASLAAGLIFTSSKQLQLWKKILYSSFI